MWTGGRGAICLGGTINRLVTLGVGGGGDLMECGVGVGDGMK